MKKLLFLLTALLCVSPIYAQQLTDPGPIWQGITDTTSFEARMEEDLAAADAALDRLRAIEGRRTVENTFMPFKKAEYYFLKAQRLARLTLNAHPDKAFRDYAQMWESRVAERATVLKTDPALYHALEAVDLSEADPAIRYIVRRKLKAFRRNGVLLDEATRERIAALRKKITELGTQFERNIFTDSHTLRVHKDSLAGVPPDWIAAHPAGEDGFITLRWTPTVARPLFLFAENAAVRRAAFEPSMTSGYPENLALMDSLRAARYKMAKLLGYSSWAEYAMEPMMARSPERVRAFLKEVDRVSGPVIRRWLDAMLSLKRAEHPAATAIDISGARYWTNKLARQGYKYDIQTIREYLPYNYVRDGVLMTFERLFGIEFRAAPDIPVWSSAVEAYEVWDDDSLIGRIYLDMHPRKGKFSANGSFRLRLGGGAIPEGALLCNFAGGKEGAPGLLAPVMLGTFFHEFGHLMHHIFRAQSPVVEDFELDFVEAPSQVMAAWARDKEVIMSFARHYKTGEPIPSELADAYLRVSGTARRSVASSIHWGAVLSLELYDGPPQSESSATVEKRVMAEYSPFPDSDWVHLATSLPIFAPYSSNVYTYLWSAVIAQDLLTAFDRENILDPEAGRRYREMILEPTGTAPMNELIEKFLGRPFNAKAWGRWLAGEENVSSN